MSAVLAVLVVAGATLSMNSLFGETETRLSAQQDTIASPAASPLASPATSPAASPVVDIPLPGTPAANLPAITGLAPTSVSADVARPTYENSTIGLSLQFPPGWTYVETADRTGVAFYPPGTDSTMPSALIAFDLIVQRPYDPTAVVSGDATAPQPITVAGVSGHWYEDAAFAIPTQGYYIELPHRGGTLVITATKGPAVNLVPILEQILPTIALLP